MGPAPPMASPLPCGIAPAQVLGAAHRLNAAHGVCVDGIGAADPMGSADPKGCAGPMGGAEQMGGADPPMGAAIPWATPILRATPVPSAAPSTWSAPISWAGGCHGRQRCHASPRRLRDRLSFSSGPAMLNASPVAAFKRTVRSPKNAVESMCRCAKMSRHGRKHCYVGHRRSPWVIAAAHVLGTAMGSAPLHIGSALLKAPQHPSTPVFLGWDEVAPDNNSVILQMRGVRSSIRQAALRRHTVRGKVAQGRAWTVFRKATIGDTSAERSPQPGAAC